jgi:hypothetical protein
MKHLLQIQSKLILPDKKQVLVKLLPLILLLFTAITCAKNGTPYATSKFNTLSVLESLEKVDSYPVYTMKYEIDYRFEDYLQTGTWPELTLSLPDSFPTGNWGCTCFSAMGTDSTHLLGRNFDWHDCIPMVLFTRPPNAYASVSTVDLEYLGFHRGNLPDEATDQHQLLYTPYLPFDGMNEKGVAVGMMAISNARGPFDESKITIGEIEVIRLILDYAASVDEALQLMQNYNIQFTQPPIHYMISDRSGKSVIVEFINGEMYTLTSSDSFHVSTNFIIHGSKAPSQTPCRRYNQTYQYLLETNGIIDHQEGLSLLQQVSQPSTIWSSLYNLQTGQIFMVPGRKHESPLRFTLSTN